VLRKMRKELGGKEKNKMKTNCLKARRHSSKSPCISAKESEERIHGSRPEAVSFIWGRGRGGEANEEEKIVAKKKKQERKKISHKNGFYRAKNQQNQARRCEGTHRVEEGGKGVAVERKSFRGTRDFIFKERGRGSTLSTLELSDKVEVGLKVVEVQKGPAKFFFIRRGEGKKGRWRGGKRKERDLVGDLRKTSKGDNDEA